MNQVYQLHPLNVILHVAAQVYMCLDLFFSFQWTVEGGGNSAKKGKGAAMKKPRALGKAAIGSQKPKKTHLSSDSSDEDEDVGDTQVCVDCDSHY